jgi:hypothetical protein
MTDQQRAAATERTLDLAIAQLEADLKAERISIKKTKPVSTPAIQAKQTRLEALKALREEMRLADPAYQAELQQKKLTQKERAQDREIAKLEKELAGKVALPGTKPTPLTNAATKAKQAKLDQLRNEREARRAADPEYQAVMDARRILAYRRSLLKRLADYEQRMADKDFAPRIRPERKLDKKTLELLYKVEQNADVFNAAAKKWKEQHFSLLKKTALLFPKTANAVRAFMTSYDFSGLGRQAKFVAAARPILVMKTLPAIFKAFGSKLSAFEAAEELRNRPGAHFAKTAKLAITIMKGDWIQQEEEYMSPWARRIPGVAASERAYVTLLNQIRADYFDTLIATLTVGGKPTAAEAKVIAAFVNTSTGRGSVGQWETAAVGLAAVFFAPRYVASRFQLLTGQPMWRGTKRTRVLIAKEYARMLIGLAVYRGIFQLAAQARYGIMGGDDEDKPCPIEWNPGSSNFLDVRIGNTRIDLTGGLASVATFVWRVGPGWMKTEEGEYKPTWGPRAGRWDWLKTWVRFGRGKLSPAFGGGVDFFVGENVVGEKTPPAAIAWNMRPLVMQEIQGAIEEEGVPKGAAIGILAIFGEGMASYNSNQWTALDNRKSPWYRKNGEDKLMSLGQWFEYDRLVDKATDHVLKLLPIGLDDPTDSDKRYLESVSTRTRKKIKRLLAFQRGGESVTIDTAKIGREAVAQTLATKAKKVMYFDTLPTVPGPPKRKFGEAKPKYNTRKAAWEKSEEKQIADKEYETKLKTWRAQRVDDELFLEKSMDSEIVQQAMMEVEASKTFHKLTRGVHPKFGNIHEAITALKESPDTSREKIKSTFAVHWMRWLKEQEWYKQRKAGR